VGILCVFEYVWVFCLCVGAFVCAGVYVLRMCVGKRVRALPVLRPQTWTKYDNTSSVWDGIRNRTFT
jgi:hypothetical protein